MAIASLSLSSNANSAQISYQGSLTNGSSSTGQVSARSWVDDIGSDVDFWAFAGVAGHQYQLKASRLDLGLDTAFSLYEGFIVADDSEFDHGRSFGGATLIDTADDELPVSGGPFGDPFLEFTALSTGIFTVAIGDFDGDGTGPFNYSLELTEVSAVPVPAAVWLFGSALIGLVGLRRKGSALQ